MLLSCEGIPDHLFLEGHAVLRVECNCDGSILCRSFLFAYCVVHADYAAAVYHGNILP